jgi:hypothetical protein
MDASKWVIACSLSMAPYSLLVLPSSEDVITSSLWLAHTMFLQGIVSSWKLAVSESLVENED